MWPRRAVVLAAERGTPELTCERTRRPRLPYRPLIGGVRTRISQPLECFVPTTSSRRRMLAGGFSLKCGPLERQSHILLLRCDPNVEVSHANPVIPSPTASCSRPLLDREFAGRQDIFYSQRKGYDHEALLGDASSDDAAPDRVGASTCRIDSIVILEPARRRGHDRPVHRQRWRSNRSSLCLERRRQYADLYQFERDGFPEG